MSRGAAPLASYALLIGASAAVQFVWSPYRLPASLLGGGAVLIAIIAAVVALRGRGEEDPGGPRAIPDSSFSIVAVAFGMCTMLVGVYLGVYLILIGGGVLVLGLGGLIRELRAERRMRESGDAR